MRRFAFLQLIFFQSFIAFSQPGSTAESSVQLQEVFIDGNREKLLGNWEKAAAKFKEVLGKDPQNDAAAYELARVYDAMKDLEKAIAAARNAVAWEPANAWYKMYLSDLYQRSGKDRDAAALYEQLAKTAPHNQEYYLKWAYYLVRASEPEKAIKVYDELEKMVGINEETTRHKHTLYLGMGDYKKAGKELEVLIAKFPKNTEYRRQLANFYQQSGDKSKAREVYRQILAINPADARAKIALAEENKDGDDARYLASLKPVFENPQTDIDLKIKQIIPYVTRLAETTDPSKIDKSISDALLELTSILERLHPANAKAFSVSGDVLNYSGDREKAIEKYKKTLDLDDTVWLVWEQLLYLYAGKKDYDNLSAASEKALDIFPNQATAHYLNGVANNGKGKPKDALSSLQQALIMSSKNQRLRYDVLIETGKAYFLSKQYSQSDNSFEEALKINPNGVTALYQYSHCLAARSEQLDKAKDLASRLNTIAPEHPSSADALGFVFYKTKDFKTAKDLFFKALQQGGDDDPVVLEHYGDVLFQTGNPTEAVQYWQKALEKGGRSEFLEKKAAEGKLFE